MKRRFLMVSAMILLLSSQVDMFAQKRDELDRKRPGMEMHEMKKPCKPMDVTTISQWEVEKLQDFYRKKYRVKLSKQEAEKILIAEKRDKKFCDKRMLQRPMAQRPMPQKPMPQKPMPRRK